MRLGLHNGLCWASTPSPADLLVSTEQLQTSDFRPIDLLRLIKKPSNATTSTTDRENRAPASAPIRHGFFGELSCTSPLRKSGLLELPKAFAHCRSPGGYRL